MALLCCTDSYHNGSLSDHVNEPGSFNAGVKTLAYSVVIGGLRPAFYLLCQHLGRHPKSVPSVEMLN